MRRCNEIYGAQQRTDRPWAAKLALGYALAPPKTLKEIYGISNLLGQSLNARQHHSNKGDVLMKRIALLTAVAMTLFSVAASAQTYYGKGKAPPPPVVTKG
jgi:hypothetical protein